MVFWNIFDNIRNSILTIDTIVDIHLETLSNAYNYRDKYIYFKAFRS